MQKKIIAVSVVVLLVANVVLMGLGKISTMTFWLVIVAAFLIAQFALPKLD